MMQCTQGDEDHRNGLIDVSNAMSDCKCGLLGKRLGFRGRSHRSGLVHVEKPGMVMKPSLYVRTDNDTVNDSGHSCS